MLRVLTSSPFGIKMLVSYPLKESKSGADSGDIDGNGIISRVS